MTTRTNRIDPQIANLNGGLFAGMSQQELPLEAFGLYGKVLEPAAPRRQWIDSMAPTAMDPAADHAAPAAPRYSSWRTGAAAAVGAACMVAGAFMASSRPSVAPMAAQAAPVVAAPMVEAAPVAVAEAAPAAAPVAAPAEVAPAVTAAVAAAPVAAPARAAAPTKAMAAPKAEVAEAAAAAPASTADLPQLADIPPAPKPAAVAFAPSSAAVAIASAGHSAASCRDGEAGSLSVPVSVTFVASGRASRVTVDGGALLGTPEGSCVARALRTASVPAFDGEPVTVHTTVQLH